MDFHGRRSLEARRITEDIDLLCEVYNRYGLKVLAHYLMKNHYHFRVQSQSSPLLRGGLLLFSDEEANDERRWITKGTKSDRRGPFNRL